MNRKTLSEKYIWLAKLCVVTVFLQASNLLQAAEAIEREKPFAAAGNLSVSIHEDREASNAEFVSYIIQFKNLDDYELEYKDFTVKFPEFAGEPELLSAAEAERLLQPAPVTQETVPSSPVIHNHYYYPSYYPHRHYHSSSSGRCKEACVVLGVILIVVVVVGVIGLIAQAGKSSEAKKEAQEKEKRDAELNQDPKAPIRLLRFQETARRITMRKADIRSFKSVVIEVIDKNDKKRSFQAVLPGRAEI